MTQMDINFCILLLYIFLRNVTAFDKELVIVYGLFNGRISKKATLLEKAPMGPKTIFLNFRFVLYKNVIILYKTAKSYVLNQSRSILLVPSKYTLEN